MTTHSGSLAWRIFLTEEPGGLHLATEHTRTQEQDGTLSDQRATHPLHCGLK